MDLKDHCKNIFKSSEATVDMNKLRKGEKIVCPLCKNGFLVPMYGANYSDAFRFKCSSCKEKLSIYIKDSSGKGDKNA